MNPMTTINLMQFEEIPQNFLFEDDNSPSRLIKFQDRANAITLDEDNQSPLFGFFSQPYFDKNHALFDIVYQQPNAFDTEMKASFDQTWSSSPYNDFGVQPLENNCNYTSNIMDQDYFLQNGDLPTTQILSRVNSELNSLAFRPNEVNIAKPEQINASDSSDEVANLEKIEAVNTITQTTKDKKTYFSNIGIEFESSNRLDIIIKNILRAARRHYLQKFNFKTRYINLKRHRTQSFYSECLTKFIEENLSSMYEHYPSEQQKLYKNEMHFLLGSLFYQKDLIKIYQNGMAQTIKIKSIHELLYNYSNSKLIKTLEVNKAFGFFIELIFLNQEKILTLINKSKKEKNDYIKGFSLLMELSNRHSQ